MPTIRFETAIAAPAERCFDLARSVDFHVASTPGTGETAIAGVRSGLLTSGDSVTWEARHFGIRQQLTSRISGYDRPHQFRDSQVQGAFRRFDHDHTFRPAPTGPAITIAGEAFDFDAPFGLFGKVAGALFLTGYMERFLRRRALLLKAALESDAWQRYLPPDT